MSNERECVLTARQTGGGRAAGCRGWRGLEVDVVRPNAGVDIAQSLDVPNAKSADRAPSVSRWQGVGRKAKQRGEEREERWKAGRSLDDGLAGK